MQMIKHSRFVEAKLGEQVVKMFPFRIYFRSWLFVKPKLLRTLISPRNKRAGEESYQGSRLPTGNCEFDYGV